MKFRVNDTDYMVKFSRINHNTFAELWELKDAVEDYVCLNILAIAELGKKDKFVKSTGRKVALAKLFKLMNHFAHAESNPKLAVTKEQRTAIWNLYFEMHRKV